MHAVYYTRTFKFLSKVVYDTLSYHTVQEIDLLQVLAFFSFAHAFSLVLRLITIQVTMRYGASRLASRTSIL